MLLSIIAPLIRARLAMSNRETLPSRELRATEVRESEIDEVDVRLPPSVVC